MELADDDALSTVDDELSATEHDGDVAEIDLFLDRLITRQTQPDTQRAAVREPELTAFVGIVAGLSQFVADVLELDGAVIALDREDFPKNTLDALVLALQRRGVVLEKAIVKARLDFSEVRNRVACAAASVTADLGGLEATDGACGHGRISQEDRSKKTKT